MFNNLCDAQRRHLDQAKRGVALGQMELFVVADVEGKVLRSIRLLSAECMTLSLTSTALPQLRAMHP